MGVVAFVPPAGPGVALHLGAAAVDFGQEPSALIGSEPSRETHGTVTVGPRPEVAPLPEPPVPVVLIGDGGRLDPTALLPQLAERHHLGGVEQLLLRGGPLRRHVGDLADLRQRQAPGPEGLSGSRQVVEQP